MLNVKRYDYGNYTKSYLNKKSTASLTGKSISLQSSPIHQSSQSDYSRSTNSTPQHFYANENKSNFNYLDEDTNLDDFLEYERGSSLEDLNCELNNQNSSNDEYDNSEESNDGERCSKTLFNNRRSHLYNQTFLNQHTYSHIKHSRSYQNNFFDLESPTKFNLDKKPTSLSLSGNNLNNNLSKLSNSNKESSSLRSRKFDMFIMTGDLILNLSKSNSEENPMCFADIANFKTEKCVLNKQKIRKIKEEKRKLNSFNNKINNSDQMRQCLSPDIELRSEFKRKDYTTNELLNNSINDHLTNSYSNDEKEKISDAADENLVVTQSNGENLIELTNEVVEEESIDDENDYLNSNSILASETNDDTFRYPTFIQQQNENDTSGNNSVIEQSSNVLHQKSIDEASARRLARRLYNLDKFRKTDIARHLSKNNEYCSRIAQEYCNFFDFTQLNLIEALRYFLSKFCLIGETAERERILMYYSRRYFTCNPSAFTSSDSVYTLTCAIMMLNGDLHGDCVSKKMSLNDFVENLKSLNDGENFARDLLKEVYNKIKNEKLEWCGDESNDQAKDDNYSQLFSNNGTSSQLSSNALLEISNSSNSIGTEYKRGFILRKCCLQANGKRVSLGKRKWRGFVAVLRDSVLYLQKGNYFKI